MKKLSNTIRFSIFFLILLSRAYADSTNVYFAVVRVDLLSFNVEGYYEFSQPLRKSLPEDGYIEIGEVFYTQAPAIDFGFTRVMSKLTGELVMHAGTVWAGGGGFEFPPEYLYSDSFQIGIDNPPPSSLDFVSLFGGSKENADTAWSKVKETDIIARLSDRGEYNVVIFDHFYSVGVGDSSTAEWIVIAFTRPPAPVDVGLIGDSWPARFITTNVTNIPEINVHNFSDDQVDFDVELTLGGSLQGQYSSLRGVSTLPANSTLNLTFDDLTIIEGDSTVLEFRLRNKDGSPLIDAFEDNNEWFETIRITDEPVFRVVSSFSRPGTVPLRGVSFDFDDDGDIDIFQYGLNPQLWRRDNEGNYENITNLSDITLDRHPRQAIAEDFNGDGLKDILIVYFNTNPIYLVGTGLGIFTDMTSESGLTSITSYWNAEAFDFENDGDIDLIFQSYGQELLLNNDGSGVFTDVTTESGLDDPNQTEDITAGDLNNDGYADVVLTNWGASPTVFTNNGDGSFSKLDGPWDFAYGRASIIFDLNDDNQNDILFLRTLDGHNMLFMNNGFPRFEEDMNQIELNIKSFDGIAADVNSDGMQDLILDDMSKLTLLLNQNGTLVDYSDHMIDSRYLEGYLGSSATPRFVDLDGDADLDIYSQATVLENLGIDPRKKIYIVDEVGRAKSYNLSHNYPNPFNPVTSIEYSLPRSGDVSLVVYNLLGEEVVRLVNGFQTTGEYTTTWNASNVSSGIYFYRLQSGDFIQTRKMVLLK